MTPKRFARIREVVEKRQKYFTVVLENIHDPHNVSAILRSADAAGIDKIFLIYNTNKFPKIGKTSSGGAKKWIELCRYDNVKDCFDKLRKDKFRIYSSYIGENKKIYNMYDLNLSGKVALVFGNEHTGVSEDVKLFSDKSFMIPMHGMIQSLNVSVAVAVCVYEALRQRGLKGKYVKSDYSKKELEKKFRDYSIK